MVKVTTAITVENGKVRIAKIEPPAKLAILCEFPGGKIEYATTPKGF